MKVKPNTKEAYKLIHDGLLALSEASMQGMCINSQYCKKTEKILHKKTQKLQKEFFEESIIGRLWKKIYSSPNINSNQQLSKILYEKKKLPVLKRTESDQPSTDNETLEILSKDYPELKVYLEYKKLHKVLNTNIKGIIKETVNGVMRPSFNLHVPVTFRSSSQNINFQNIPNRDEQQKTLVRKAILPRPGHQIITADFSGIEVNISACNHKDPNMLHYVRHPEKNNMHTDMAIQIFQLDKFEKQGGEKTLRKGTKNGFVFPQFYGDYYGNNAVSLASWANLPNKGQFKENDGLTLMSGEFLGQHLIRKGITSFDEFLEHVKEVENDFWGRRFKVYKKWKEAMVEQYYEQGCLHMLTGFTCSGVLGKNDITNYPIQGPAFHYLLKTFIKLNEEIKERGLKSRLVGQIHDELVLDAHPDEVETLATLIQWIACEWLLDEWKWVIVPMEVEMTVFAVDANWASDSEVRVLNAG